MKISKKLVSTTAGLLVAASSLSPATLFAQTAPAAVNVFSIEGGPSDIVTRGVLVKEGDTFASIARNELGKTAYAALLAEFNGLAVIDVPVPGSVLKIPMPIPKSDEFAEVVFVKGEATLLRQLSAGSNSSNPDEQPSPQELSRESKIVIGDLIKTEKDGYVSIEFFSGAVINLQPNTQAILEKLACLETDDKCLVEINTQTGRVTADINARDQQPLEFTIRTPYASAAVRGTMFDVAAEDQLLIGVTEGAVAITAQDQDVDLDTGFGVAVELDKLPGDLVELSPAPVFKRIPARMAIGDTIAWWQVYDSSAYEASVSLDEGGRQTITSFNVASAPTDLDVQDSTGQSLDAGVYYLTMRAIDSTGLLGFRSRTSIVLADIDPSIEPVKTAVSREDDGFIVTVVDGPEDAPGYEIQISEDVAFTDPLSVDVNESGSAIFRVEQDQVFTRARVLKTPTTVSAFGETSSN